MVVPTDWTKEEHERITQIFFENFNVPGLYLAEEPLMTIYGCGVVTGLVIDIGHNSTGMDHLSAAIPSRATKVLLQSTIFPTYRLVCF
jgi:hypothetical protein